MAARNAAVVAIGENGQLEPAYNFVLRKAMKGDTIEISFTLKQTYSTVKPPVTTGTETFKYVDYKDFTDRVMEIIMRLKPPQSRYKKLILHSIGVVPTALEAV